MASIGVDSPALLSGIAPGGLTGQALMKSGAAPSATGWQLPAASTVIPPQVPAFWTTCTFTGNVQAATQLYIAAGSVYYVPFWVDRDTTMNLLSFWCQQTNNGTAMMGIYRADGTQGGPGTSLATTTSDATGTGSFSYATVSLRVTPGWYFMAILNPSSATTSLGVYTTFASAPVCSGVTSPVAGGCYEWWTASGLSTLPANAGVTVGEGFGFVPILMYRSA